MTVSDYRIRAALGVEMRSALFNSSLDRAFVPLRLIINRSQSPLLCCMKRTLIDAPEVICYLWQMKYGSVIHRFNIKAMLSVGILLSGPDPD